MHIRTLSHCRGVDELKYLGIEEADSVQELFEKYKKAMYDWVANEECGQDTNEELTEWLPDSINEFSNGTFKNEFDVNFTDEGKSFQGIVVGEKSEYSPDDVDEYGFYKAYDWEGNIFPYETA